jgi:hypothetical protein
MKKIFIFLGFMVLILNKTNAQTDTIFTLNDTIIGTVTELGFTELKYTPTNNKALQIILNKSAINRIHFSNGEVTVFDSTLKIIDATIDSLHEVVLTHFENETKGLKLIGIFPSLVTSSYYYSNTVRPKLEDHLNIKNVAAYIGAQLVYLPEKGLISNGPDSKGNYEYAVKAEYYTTKLRDFSYYQNIIKPGNWYKCWQETRKYSHDIQQYTIDSNQIRIIFDSIKVENNVLSIRAIIGDDEQTYTPISIQYLDSIKFIGTYISNRKTRKITYYFIPLLTPKKKNIFGQEIND